MKKSLLAVAVASALPAFAYAQTNVTLYGIVDLRVEQSNAAANAGIGSNFRVDDNVGSGSRFGIRGSEELGGGMKANFQIEHRFSPDTGDTRGGVAGGAGATPNAAGAGGAAGVTGFPNGITGAGTNGNPTPAGNMKFWNGQSWVGLSGGWGEVRMGRQYTPMFWAMIGSDTTGYNHYNNVAGAGGSATRFDNMVEYRTPTFGGIQGILAYAPDETAGVKRDAAGGALIWNSGPFNAGLGYHQIGQGAAKTEQWSVSGAWKLGIFHLGGGYAKTETAGVEREDPYVSVGAKLGPGDLWLNVRRADFAGTAADVTLVGLTYNYPMSRRTSLYASVRSDQTKVGPDPRAFAVGVRHLF